MEYGVSNLCVLSNFGIKIEILMKYNNTCEFKKYSIIFVIRYLVSQHTLTIFWSRSRGWSIFYRQEIKAQESLNAAWLWLILADITQLRTLIDVAQMQTFTCRRAEPAWKAGFSNWVLASSSTHHSLSLGAAGMLFPFCFVLVSLFNSWSSVFLFYGKNIKRIQHSQ